MAGEQSRHFKLLIHWASPLKNPTNSEDTVKHVAESAQCVLHGLDSLAHLKQILLPHLVKLPNTSNLVQQGVGACIYGVCHHWLLCDLTQVHLQVPAPGH